jgi:hypothetical protein
MPRLGFIIYRGPSQLDGRTPIVAVATTRTRNAKTGPMLQTWILRADKEPVSTVKRGLDAAICGRCPYRAGNGCYVNIGHAPRSIYLAFKRGTYRKGVDLASIGEGKRVRLGSYGDPMAVPSSVWNALVSRASGWSGYTHQWSWHPDAKRFRKLVMASVDSVAERAAARGLGFRTFRVKTNGAPRERGEVVCPAAAESGKRTTCADCLACNGANGRTLDVVIDAHGAKSQRVELYQLGSL